jgi:CheY-like chemotaxis protein
MRIFLVEDNQRFRDQLQDALGAAGNQVVAMAGSSAEAVRWLDDHPREWDLAIVDIFLSAGHGFDVLRRCRTRLAHQRAVVLSNYTREPVREHARLAGADAVFDKSWELEGLLKYCEQLREKSVPAAA